MVKSISVNKEIKESIIKKFEGFEVNPPQYASHAFKKDGLRIVIYNSLKVVFSGKFDISLIEEFIESTNYYQGNIVGSDEVGTGDFFGPIIVVSAFIDDSNICKLEQMQIADSKRLSDERILAIAKELVKFITYEVVECSNEKYNDLYSKGYHIKQILAMMHYKAISNLNKDCSVVVDQFVNKPTFEKYLNRRVDYIFKTKAESSDLCVAVASIIARAYFIRSMNNLAKELGVSKVVYGAGSECDEFARKVYKNIEQSQFENYIKKNFKNYERIRKNN